MNKKNAQKHPGMRSQRASDVGVWVNPSATKEFTRERKKRVYRTALFW